MITLVLVSIVLLLFGANVYYHFFPKKEEPKTLMEEPIDIRKVNLGSIIQFGESNTSNDFAEIKKNLTAIERKLEKNASRIEYAFQRINKIENALMKNSSGGLNLELYKKIEKLEDFRREAIITIEAMKDYLKSKSNKKRQKLEDAEMEEKIRSLIFRARNDRSF
ncbi:MAG: hypothetical protein QXM75_04025 [Candidatus Diapherotrites archaeon]